jgi:hypothetical protein
MLYPYHVLSPKVSVSLAGQTTISFFQSKRNLISTRRKNNKTTEGSCVKIPSFDRRLLADSRRNVTLSERWEWGGGKRTSVAETVYYFHRFLSHASGPEIFMKEAMDAAPNLIPISNIIKLH